MLVSVGGCESVCLQVRVLGALGFHLSLSLTSSYYQPERVLTPGFVWFPSYLCNSGTKQHQLTRSIMQELDILICLAL